MNATTHPVLDVRTATISRGLSHMAHRLEYGPPDETGPLGAGRILCGPINSRMFMWEDQFFRLLRRLDEKTARSVFSAILSDPS
jgi:hypothetical protein